MNQDQFPITAIYAGIGRGHPNYLDSVLRCISRDYPDLHKQIRVITVTAVSRGFSKLAWRGVTAVYRAGSRGGAVSRTYTRIRTRHPGYDSDSVSMRLLGRDLRVFLRGYDGLCLVAHPLLAAILQPDHRVFYLHGEIAAPRESAVDALERIYVPVAETKAKMTARGVDPDSILETGLVLEPEILNGLETTIENRRRRIESDQPLTIGFFISGAYPRRHAALMTEAARSCLDNGYRTRLFWGTDSRHVTRLRKALRRSNHDVSIDDASASPTHDSPCVIVTASAREEETLRSLAYLPGLDLFCAAPHERINWAVGAGLPIMMIGPPIGSFAPENRGYVLRTGCGAEIASPETCKNFTHEIDTMRRNGTLVEMVEAGRRTRSIDGARVIADDVKQSIAWC